VTTADGGNKESGQYQGFTFLRRNIKSINLARTFSRKCLCKQWAVNGTFQEKDEFGSLGKN
jgi:hypothetical protein